MFMCCVLQWLRTAFSVLLDRLDLSETIAELGAIAQAAATIIHLIRVARAQGAANTYRNAGGGEREAWQAVTFEEYTREWKHDTSNAEETERAEALRPRRQAILWHGHSGWMTNTPDQLGKREH